MHIVILREICDRSEPDWQYVESHLEYGLMDWIVSKCDILNLELV